MVQVRNQNWTSSKEHQAQQSPGALAPLLLWAPLPSPQALSPSLRPKPPHQSLQSPGPHLLLALLLQVHLYLQRLAGLQKGLAVLAVCHVVGHDAHNDGAQVEEDIGQDLDPKEERTAQ